MITIQSAAVSATINPKGAELVSLIHKRSQIEYMWSADPAFWAKSSPVLFPIVGALKNNLFIYKGQEYTLPRHGFARDKIFEIEKQTENSVVLLLKHNEETLSVYPFAFEFRLSYTVDMNQLKVKYEVTNIGQEKMYFSVGGHPAFKVPIVEGTSYDNYYLEFNAAEELIRWPLADGGLIGSRYEKFATDSNRIPLTKELFYQDALVFKHLESDEITLKSDKTPHQLRFYFKGFPYLGIWAAKEADFVCIEPWCGIADSVEHDQQLEKKEGINVLNQEGSFERTWSVEIGD